MVADPESPVVGILKIEGPIGLKLKLGSGWLAPGAGDTALRHWQSQAPSVQRQRHLAIVRAGQTLRIGRSKNNDLVLEDGNVSRFHAILTASSSGAVLSDLSSLNGTFVNNRRTTIPVNLKSGDQINFGESDLLLEFQLAGPSTDPETSEAQTLNAGMKAIDVTVLLVDVCGYTKISQTLPATDVAQSLQAWFQEVDRVIKRHGGEVDKYIGDCAMALWRGKGYSEQSALAAAQAAREIIAETRVYSQTHWPHHNNFPWRCRVALNSGQALAGRLGTSDAREFTVLGDSINVAFRLESIASHFGTEAILGEQTAELIRHHIPVVTLGNVELEGRSGEVAVYTFKDQV